MLIIEQYRKYVLIALIILLGYLMMSGFFPFMSGILGACTVYILVRKHMRYLTDQKKMKKSLAATAILLEVLLCFLIPTFIAIWLIINQILSIDLNPNYLIDEIQKFVDIIQHKIGYDILSKDNVTTFVSFVSRLGQIIVGEISGFFVNSAVLLFVLYFMLVSSKEFEQYIYGILPFDDKNKARVLKEVDVKVRSNAVGIPLQAIVQGLLALIAYYVFDVPNPFLFGFLTCITTIVPVIGTAIVWVPLSIYLAATDHWANAIGLAIFALIVISGADNLLRFVLQKKMANTHPLITVFGVVIGLSIFGFWGIIFGPLLISITIVLFNIFREEYLGLDTPSDSEGDN